MRKTVKQIFPLFLPVALAITLVLGIIYVVIWQNYRMSANDPQIQIAEDVARLLAKGQQPEFFIPSTKTDISQSLGSFILIYDKHGKTIGSSALINNKQPVMPTGVFNTTKVKTQTRFTWAPEKNVRIALVMVYYKGANEGYVALGKSLREIDSRINNLGALIFLGWVFSLSTLFIFLLALKKTPKT